MTNLRMICFVLTAHNTLSKILGRPFSGSENLIFNTVDKYFARLWRKNSGQLLLIRQKEDTWKTKNWEKCTISMISHWTYSCWLRWGICSKARRLCFALPWWNLLQSDVQWKQNMKDLWLTPTHTSICYHTSRTSIHMFTHISYLLG